jgi:8-amino-7-oxononanoate synthase
MDGDLAPLTELATLSKEHNALLYIDEAHATGVFGNQGLGLAGKHLGEDFPLVTMGTFSKALGGSGAYVCSSHSIKKYLINKASGFIYSTAPSPIAMAAASKAWDLMKPMTLERQRILKLAEGLRCELKDLDFDTGSSNSHIIPIKMAHEDQAMAAKNILLQAGVSVSAIRPPTVPIGTSRLRVALTAMHSEMDMERLLKGLKKLLREISYYAMDLALIGTTGIR